MGKGHKIPTTKSDKNDAKQKYREEVKARAERSDEKLPVFARQMLHYRGNAYCELDE